MLAGYLVGFREELARCGYAPVRLGAHLELLADLCRWMEREGVELTELGSDRVAAFLEDRRHRGQTDLISCSPRTERGPSGFTLGSTPG